MKLDITGDVQSSTVLELNDAELASVSGGYAHDRDRWHEHEHWHRWWGHRDWQGADYYGDDCGSQSQVIFVEQQPTTYMLVPASSPCGC